MRPVAREAAVELGGPERGGGARGSRLHTAAGLVALAMVERKREEVGDDRWGPHVIKCKRGKPNQRKPLHKPL